MKFVQKDHTSLFLNTSIPDVFFDEYLSQASGDFIKVYLYIFYLSKYNKDIKLNDLSQKLNLPSETIKEAFQYWENENVIIKTPNGFIFSNLQELELNNLYTPKLTSSPEDIQKIESNKSKAKAIESINNQCFQGMMRPTWYNDINLWFNKYGFDEQVMIALFNYCFQKNGTSRNYIQTVAEDWANNKVKTYSDLENYFVKYENLNLIKNSISKKLGIRRGLTKYETDYIENWVIDYGYSIDIIEIALKKTASKTNPNFQYINTLISDWHNKNLKTTEEIENYLSKSKVKTTKTSEKKTDYNNYNQRKYDNIDSLYSNNI